MPSSPQIAWASWPVAARSRAPRAIAQGAWTRRPEGREHAQAPVADLVAEPLDHDRAVARHGPGGRGLVLEVGDQVGRGAPVERALGPQPGCRPLGTGGDQLARQPPHGLAELVGPPHALALPERHRARSAGRRGHDHPVAGDLLDAPGGGAEHEGLARARLVDHLLVQLAHPRAVGQHHGVEPPVGDRARVLHRQRPRARRGRGPCRRCGPTPPAAAAPRTRRRGSGRRACRAPPPAARATARRRGTRPAPPRSRSSTLHVSPEHMATICCARTSSGSRGTRVSSMAPRSMRDTTAAHSSRSPRYLGNTTPRLGAPT